jgi:OOP family OmpA-OmpF porin
MRISALRTVVGVGLALNTMAAPAAIAQSDQSANQIINSLKPSGDLSTTTRGIKPLPPGNGAMTSQGASGAGGGAGVSSDSGSAAAASPAPLITSTPATSPASGQETQAPSANLAIAFASGSANLTPHAVAQLDQLGKALTSAQLASYNFKIVGHTDTTGDAATNQSLSEQRAAAVKSYLESKFSVADSRLQATGVGESDLMVPTPAQTPEPRNRQVQIINLGQ